MEEIEAMHPELLPGLTAHPGVGFVLVRSERTVQPNTFWLGYEEIAEVPAA